MMGRPQTISLAIASRLELADVVQAVLARLAAVVGFDEDSIHYMSVAVRESVINAIRHGNAFDESKQVSISFLLDQETLEISVQDQGRGFDPDAVRDPLASENLLRADGRGIFFMRSFMDGISFSFPPRGGTIVRMVKRLGSPPVSEGAGPGE
jgi:serine/threonine-protein kinase RsbW